MTLNYQLLRDIAITKFNLFLSALALGGSVADNDRGLGDLSVVRAQTTAPLQSPVSRGGRRCGRARPHRGHREIYFLINSSRQLPVRGRRDGGTEGGVKDGNGREMEVRDGQGHVSMEILWWRDVKGGCCDCVTRTHATRSRVQRVKDGKKVGPGKEEEGATQGK